MQVDTVFDPALEVFDLRWMDEAGIVDPDERDGWLKFMHPRMYYDFYSQDRCFVCHKRVLHDRFFRVDCGLGLFGHCSCVHKELIPLNDAERHYDSLFVVQQFLFERAYYYKRTWMILNDRWSGMFPLATHKGVADLNERRIAALKPVLAVKYPYLDIDEMLNGRVYLQDSLHTVVRRVDQVMQHDLRIFDQMQMWRIFSAALENELTSMNIIIYRVVTEQDHSFVSVHHEDLWKERSLEIEYWFEKDFGITRNTVLEFIARNDAMTLRCIRRTIMRRFLKEFSTKECIACQKCWFAFELLYKRWKRRLRGIVRYLVVARRYREAYYAPDGGAFVIQAGKRFFANGIEIVLNKRLKP